MDWNPEQGVYKKAAAMLRIHGGDTRFRKAERREPGLASVLHSAEEGLEKADATNIDPAVPENFEMTGAKLSTMTQALLYQGIFEREKVPQRRGTTICLDMTRHAVYDLSGFLPSDNKIWHSLRNKDISRNIQVHMWKCMRNTLQIGAYWLNIPGYEQRAMCRVCGCDESLEHILTDTVGSICTSPECIRYT